MLTNWPRTLVHVLGFVFSLLIPTLAFSQASVVGTVKDTSGAVLPGVTVEAASPVLIEKVRSVVTDASGQFRVVNLRPGVYSLTFTLPGFNTFKRDGVELTGGATVTVNADLRVGAIEETVTVTGNSPVVDVQSTTTQRVLDSEALSAIPSGRQAHALAALVPGISIGSGLVDQDVGGSNTQGNRTMVSHGSRTSDGLMLQDGVSVGTIQSAGFGQLTMNPGVAQEVTVDSGGVSAEVSTGGPRVNLIPKDGGNKFAGSVFATFANSSLQGSNFTDRVKDLGLSTPDSIREVWDVNPGLGGPVIKDRMWFYLTLRHNGSNANMGGMFHDLNATNPNAWAYAPDYSRPGFQNATWRDAQLRLTWQATQRNKFAFSMDQQDRCSCPRYVGAQVAATGAVSFIAPEAGRDFRVPKQQMRIAQWSSPVTNQLLLEAAVMRRTEYYRHMPASSQGFPLPGAIPLVEQSTNLTYRAWTDYSIGDGPNWFSRGTVSYLTGSHSFKFGFNDTTGDQKSYQLDPAGPLAYRVNTVNGVTRPNQLTITNKPYQSKSNLDADFGVYGQDRWTMKRLTVTAGIRYDHYSSSFPAQHVGPSDLLPNQSIDLPAQRDASYHDVSPKTGAVYDMFGDGRTALRVSLNKYLGFQGVATARNPVSNLVQSTTRSWNDANNNWVPDCDILNPAANAECGAMANANFGKSSVNTTYAPEFLTGWNHRFQNWEFSAGVQHELLRRVAIDVGYFRRWYGNFAATDNTLVSPSNFSAFRITAPIDPRLPDGGGYVVSNLYNLNPDKVGQVQNVVTLAKNFGEQSEQWDGVDINLNVRPGRGLLFQGGTSTGRTVTDNCAVLANLPEMAPTGMPDCHQNTGLRTQVKMIGSYTVPRIDVQVSGAFQSIPGATVLATYNATNAEVVSSLGRPLSGGAANVGVNLVALGKIYGERLNQLDLRFGKILRMGTRRAVVSLDLYNAMNVDTVTVQQSAYAAWRKASSTIQARFAKFSVQFDF